MKTEAMPAQMAVATVAFSGITPVVTAAATAQAMIKAGTFAFSPGNGGCGA
jgi:hypothetical protein